MLLTGDCLNHMPTLEADSIDAIVTDPPYGLSFMGRDWDHGVPGEHFWREALRVAKPGAHLLAFGGTRTHHRLMCAIEDAGWEIRDCLGWLYGSGFPKSLDVSKAIDGCANINEQTYRRIALVAEVIRSHREAKGMERSDVSLAVVGTPSGACWNWEHHQLPSVGMWPLIKATLDIPDKFDGLISGTREMFIGATREVIRERTMKQGGGNSLQIRQGELREAQADITAPATDAAKKWSGWGTALKPAWEPIILARKPPTGTVASNVATYGTGALNIDASRVGTADNLNGGRYSDDKDERDGNAYGAGINRRSATEYAQPEGRWPANIIHDGSDEVLAVFPQAGGKWGRQGDRQPSSMFFGEHAAGIAADSERFIGDSGSAARFFYCAKASKSERGEGNNHPTVKPLALMRYLVRLITPPCGTVYDPFAGSGTTLLAAKLEGFGYIGSEQDPEYAAIAEARLAAAIVQMIAEYEEGL